MNRVKISDYQLALWVTFLQSPISIMSLTTVYSEIISIGTDYFVLYFIGP